MVHALFVFVVFDAVWIFGFVVGVVIAAQAEVNEERLVARLRAEAAAKRLKELTDAGAIQVREPFDWDLGEQIGGGQGWAAYRRTPLDQDGGA